MFPISRSDSAFKTICWWAGSSDQQSNGMGFLTFAAPTAPDLGPRLAYNWADRRWTVLSSHGHLSAEPLHNSAVAENSSQVWPYHTDDFSINEFLPQAPRDTVSREYQESSTLKMCCLQLAFPALLFSTSLVLTHAGFISSQLNKV